MSKTIKTGDYLILIFYGILKVPQLIMGIILLGIDKTSEIIVGTLPKLRIWFGKLISHQ